MQVNENLGSAAVKPSADALVPQQSDRQKWWQHLTEYSLIAIFAVMFITMSLTVDHFFSIDNMLGLALSISQIGMVACTMMFCLASRDFDLSIGSTVAFSGVLCAMVLNATDNTFVAIVAAVAAGAAIGFVNGAVIAYLRINALITTLATMEIVRARLHRVEGAGGRRVVGYVHRARRAVALRRVAADLGHAAVLHRVRRAAEPDGLWPQHARDRRQPGSLAARGDQRRTHARVHLPDPGRGDGARGRDPRIAHHVGQPNAAQGFELNVISACVLGGVSLMGGRATISGVVIGVLIMGTVENVMNLLNIDAFYQYLVRGAILLAAVLLDQLKNRGVRD